MKTEFSTEESAMIFKNKLLISELSKIQDLYLTTLSQELNLNELGEEWLFDYLFNEDKGRTFEQYVKDYNLELKTLFLDQEDETSNC